MKILLCLALLLLAGCATTSKYEAKVQSWEGKSASTLLNSWGQPDAIEKLSNGNRMFVYARLRHDPLAYGQSTRQSTRKIASVENPIPGIPGLSPEPPSDSASSLPTASRTAQASAEVGRVPAGSVYIQCATYFEVDPNNTIVSTFFRGDSCKSDN